MPPHGYPHLKPLYNKSQSCSRKKTHFHYPAFSSTKPSSFRSAVPMPAATHPQMAQKVILKIGSLSDEKSRRKAMETVAEILGVDSISVDMKEQKLTVVGVMDAVKMAKKLKKMGKVDILHVGPAKEEKKEEKKEDKKEEKKKEEKKKEEKVEDKKEGAKK